jgi:F-type H+-transporting ATPase subunit b
MRFAFAALMTVAASPAFAADGPFVSLKNTDFVVLLAFLVFIGVLFYFKVPGLLTGMLDKRADDIRDELNEAKALHEEAKTLLASYERKQKEVQAQADRIVEAAKADAAAAADQAREDIKTSVARRLAAAEEQIVSAQNSAVKEVRDAAVTVAVSAARDVIAKQTTAASQNALIDEAIATVADKLH